VISSHCWARFGYGRSKSQQFPKTFPRDGIGNFNDPVPLPKGKPPITLRDAALYITKLPTAELDADEWQAPVEALLLVAEYGGQSVVDRGL
jgi:hypothetical protein